MKKYELLRLLRHDFSKYIRNKYIKNKCENCGSNIDLHLHHEYAFKNYFEYTLNLLKINDNNVFIDGEVEKIRYIMLGLQCSNEGYKTLCKDCHIQKHLMLSQKTDLDKIKSNNKFIDYINDNWMDELIYKDEDKQSIVNNASNLGIKKDVHGNPHTFNSIIKYLKSRGYKINKKRTMIKWKQFTTYKINI